MLIVYYRSGAKSRQACEILAQHNFTVFNLEGGITAWKSAGYPTTAFNPSPTPVPTPTQTPTQMPEATPETPAPTVSEQPAQTPTTSPVSVPGVPGFETIFAVAAVLLAVSLLRGRKWRNQKCERKR